MNTDNSQNSFHVPLLRHTPHSLSVIEKSLLANLIVLVRPRWIIELGLFEAVTTEFMCEVLSYNQIDGRVVGFDLPDVNKGIRQTNPKIREL